MGKKTATLNKERVEAVKEHVAWAVQQAPLVEVLSRYAEGCMVFVPFPTERSTGQFDHAWVAKKAYILPDICEDTVTIPANSARLSLMDDHGRIVSIGPDPLAGAPRRRYVTIADDIEVVVPGGQVSHMEKTEAGYVVKEPANIDDEAKAPEEKKETDNG